MNTVSYLLLFCLALVGVKANNANGNANGNGNGNMPCNFNTILAQCGGIKLHSIDDSVYGYKPLADFKVNVIDSVKAYADRLETDPYVEGRDNPDVAISYAFMHYICFDAIILDGEEHLIYECMAGFCPRVENIEAWCEGMNS